MDILHVEDLSQLELSYYDTKLFFGLCVTNYTVTLDMVFNSFSTPKTSSFLSSHFLQADSFLNYWSFLMNNLGHPLQSKNQSNRDSWLMNSNLFSSLFIPGPTIAKPVRISLVCTPLALNYSHLGDIGLEPTDNIIEFHKQVSAVLTNSRMSFYNHLNNKRLQKKNLPQYDLGVLGDKYSTKEANPPCFLANQDLTETEKHNKFIDEEKESFFGVKEVNPNLGKTLFFSIFYFSL